MGKRAEMRNFILFTENCFNQEVRDTAYPGSTIVVVGRSDVSQSVLVQIGRDLGFKQECFLFDLAYRPRNIHRYRNRSRYAALLVGPVAHSGHGKGTHSSILTSM